MGMVEFVTVTVMLLGLSCRITHTDIFKEFEQAKAEKSNLDTISMQLKENGHCAKSAIRFRKLRKKNLYL